MLFRSVVSMPGTRASPEEDMQAGQQGLSRLLAAGVTALFCANDMIAIGALLACREQGIAVPQDLSVVGFDDIMVASYVTPALTTIRQPKAELGRIATRTLLDLLDKRPAYNHTLLPTLTIRASTTSPRA